ncbi:MAG: MBL fold metallo-hydrolase, partial [Clostridia bacterium]|nr:MBL fold metallo-hydrolase [Clostridia bacterium]
MVEITLLGTGGTLPVKGKWLSSAMIRCLGLTVLLDCGEGTQMAARAANMPLSGIDVICITHYHGDHIAGLPGMLLSIGHEGRTRPVDIYGPPGLAAVVNALRVLAPSLPFEVRLHELSGKTDEPFYSSGHISLGAFPLDHSVPCLGYTFDLFRPGKFDIKKATPNPVVQAAPDLVYNGSNQTLLTPATSDESYAVQYSLTGDDGSYSANIEKIFGNDAKAYTVYYKVEGNDCYEELAQTSIEAIIHPKTITATHQNDYTIIKDYDGTTKITEDLSPLVTLSGVEAVDNGKVTL